MMYGCYNLLLKHIPCSVTLFQLPLLYGCIHDGSDYYMVRLCACVILLLLVAHFKRLLQLSSNVTSFTTPDTNCLSCFNLLYVAATLPHVAAAKRLKGLVKQVKCCNMRHTSHVTCHTSHVTRHTSHVTRHTSHVTRHTSHVIRHTSHVTRHTKMQAVLSLFTIVVIVCAKISLGITYT